MERSSQKVAATDGQEDRLIGNRAGATPGAGRREHGPAGRGQSLSRTSRGVRGLTAAVAVASAAVGLVALAAPASAAGYDPASDPNSMSSTTASTGAAAWWNAGYTGKGVDVAVIDTGVAPVPGLDGAGKVVNGPDLSLESQNPSFRYLDTNGHGTFMAGLIAGRDATLTVPYASAPASAYRGMAPDARIVSLKVATADGGTDVSQVIAAINWVTEHKNDNGMNIRVLNLSYGTNSTQSSTVDPLSFAVEQAWKKGIVVVASAGNSGFQAEKGLANPASNRFVIGVGGFDTRGTTSLGDDDLGVYSAGIAHSGDRAPDFAAAGSHLQGLRVPNSYLDATHPEGVLGSRYFRGSGTSEAAAITSGTVALILQKYPTLTPDRVKRFIATNTDPATGADPDPDYWGSGKVSLARLATRTPAAHTQVFTPATGAGSLEAARGTDHLSANGVVLTGEKDIFGRTFNATTVAAASAAGSSWSGGTWNGSSWAGSSWAGSSWAGSSWAGSSWAGSSWAGSSWAGSSWAGNSWSGSSWSGSSWAGSSWSGSSWSGSSWAAGTWS
jgi:serine protease AprX